MAWATDTIKFAVAQRIFKNVHFVKVTICGEVAGYSAQCDSAGIDLEDRSLTNLCIKIWQLAYAELASTKLRDEIDL